MAKITVKPKNWVLDNYKGKIQFSFETDVRLSPQNYTELLTKIGGMIANELENNELLKQSNQALNINDTIHE